MQDKEVSLTPGWEGNKTRYCYCCPDYFHSRCISTVGHTCGGSGASKSILAFLSLGRRGRCRSLEYPSSSLCLYGFFSGSLAWISIRTKGFYWQISKWIRKKKMREIKEKKFALLLKIVARGQKWVWSKFWRHFKNLCSVFHLSAGGSEDLVHDVGWLKVGTDINAIQLLLWNLHWSFQMSAGEHS